MEQALRKLKSEVKSLLEEYPEGIKFNSFWGLYERKYHSLPNVKVFKVQKRSDILNACSDVYRIVGSGSAAVLHLKHSDHSDEHPHSMSKVAQEQRGEKVQGQTCAPQTQTLAGTSQFAAGGSFYQRFYSDSDTQSDSKAGPGGSHGSYSSLMEMHSRPNTVPHPPIMSNPPTFLPEQFAVPVRMMTPLATGGATGQHFQTPRSRDSSASRSSDGARNQSPAPAVRQTGPRHQFSSTSTPLIGRPLALVAMTGRGRRTQYSRDQLNTAAEDCIDLSLIHI